MLLQYIIPGYITITLIAFGLSKKINKSNAIIFSCIVSYVLLSAISLLRVKYFKQIPNNAIINSSLSIILGVISSCIIVFISQTKKFKQFSIKLFHKTLNDDIWRDIFDLENGSNLKVYLKNTDYYLIGHLKNYEEKGNDSWLALSAFGKFDKTENILCKNEPQFLNDSNILIAIRFSDIESIQIF